MSTHNIKDKGNLFLYLCIAVFAVCAFISLPSENSSIVKYIPSIVCGLMAVAMTLSLVFEKKIKDKLEA